LGRKKYTSRPVCVSNSANRPNSAQYRSRVLSAHCMIKFKRFNVYLRLGCRLYFVQIGCHQISPSWAPLANRCKKSKGLGIRGLAINPMIRGSDSQKSLSLSPDRGKGFFFRPFVIATFRPVMYRLACQGRVQSLHALYLAVHRAVMTLQPTTYLSQTESIHIQTADDIAFFYDKIEKCMRPLSVIKLLAFLIILEALHFHSCPLKAHFEFESTNH
jgi:hypothetical protein